MQLFDEIAIVYQGQSKELLTFLENYKGKKVTLEVKQEYLQEFHDGQTWKLINAIAERAPEVQLTVRFFAPCKFDECDKILEDCIQGLAVPFYFGFVIKDYDKLHYVCQKGASEVYIGEELCFDLARVTRVCMQYGVQIRTFPNVAQASVRSGPALKKFFIRPEDVEEYSEYIDTLEFWGPLDRQVTLLRIYKGGTWFGDLNELILDLNTSLDSRTLVPVFAQARKNCQRKCMKGGACSICERLQSIGEKLGEQGYIIKTKKRH